MESGPELEPNLHSFFTEAAGKRRGGAGLGSHTWEGISNRWLYSRESNALAAGSENISRSPSKVSFLPSRNAMLPRWHKRVLRWPISMSAFGVARVLTQSRKFSTC